MSIVVRRVRQVNFRGKVRMMNRLLLELGEVSTSTETTILSAQDRRTQYVRKFIWREKIGESLRIGVVDHGNLDDCIAHLQNDGSLALATGEHTKVLLKKAQRPRLDLILALPPPLRLKRMLPIISMLGVDRLFLCGSKQSDKTYFGSILLRNLPRVGGIGRIADAQNSTGELRSLFIEGAEQSGFTAIPTLALCSNLRTALTSAKQQNTLQLAAHPDRGPNYSFDDGSSMPRPQSVNHFFDSSMNKVLLAVGPERGWHEPSEIQYFIECGFHLVTLGPRTLRTDVALTSLLALVHDRLLFMQ